MYLSILVRFILPPICLTHLPPYLLPSRFIAGWCYVRRSSSPSTRMHLHRYRCNPLLPFFRLTWTCSTSSKRQMETKTGTLETSRTCSRRQRNQLFDRTQNSTSSSTLDGEHHCTTFEHLNSSLLDNYLCRSACTILHPRSSWNNPRPDDQSKRVSVDECEQTYNIFMVVSTR
jgi:hypothetical protein